MGGNKPAINYIRAASQATRVLREDGVCELTGLKPGTLRDLLKQGQFPEPITIGRLQGRAVGWLSDEVLHWIDQRISKRNDRIQTSKAGNTIAYFQPQTD